MLGRNAEAQHQLELAERIFSGSSDLHFVKGFELLNSGSLADAEQEFRSSLEIEPSDETSRALALAYKRQARFLDASNVLAQAAKLSTQPYPLYLELGFAQLNMDLPEQALVAFGQAEKTSPFVGEGAALGTGFNARLAEGYQQAWWRLAEMYESRGLRTEALHAQQQADSAGREQAWWKMADNYETQGLQIEASNARQQAISAASSRQVLGLTK